MAVGDSGGDLAAGQHLGERQFAEEVGRVFERFGIARMAGRMLGWLLICDPPPQSSADLGRALGASTGAISVATRLLESYGLARRVAARQAYAALSEAEGRPGTLPAAIRSSATAEDLPGASFAGQQETYLNIVGADGLLDAVRRCWASLWTARSLAYRHRLGIEQRTVAMAVVVHVLTPAQVAGVMFTANPASGARDELLFNASYGLGEAIVSGQVTPDTFVIDRQSLEVRSTTLGSKLLMIVSDEAAGAGVVSALVTEG